MDLFHKNIQIFASQNMDGLEWCRLLVDYCDDFISCLDIFWRHPFTADDPFVS